MAETAGDVHYLLPLLKRTAYLGQLLHLRRPKAVLAALAKPVASHCQQSVAVGPDQRELESSCSLAHFLSPQQRLGALDLIHQLSLLQVSDRLQLVVRGLAASVEIVGVCVTWRVLVKRRVCWNPQPTETMRSLLTSGTLVKQSSELRVESA